MKQYQYRIYLLLFTTCLLLLLGGCQKQEEALSLSKDSIELTTKAIQTEEESSTEMTYLYVHVCGAVEEPGVYKLRADARIVDALSAAGGMRADADGDYLNLALPCYDGQKIVVYTVDEAATAEETSVMEDSSNQSSALEDGKVHLNSCSVEELTTLPGIGLSKAQWIIDYRDKYGGFSSTEELTMVEGIGEATYEKLKERISL